MVLYPLSNFFYKIKCGGGSSRPAPLCHISLSSLSKCGFTVLKIAKIANFCIILPKRVIPLKRFYQIWLGENVPGPHPHATFHRCDLNNMVLQPPKLPKFVFFYINLPKRDSLTRFLRNLAREGSSRSALSC